MNLRQLSFILCIVSQGYIHFTLYSAQETKIAAAPSEMPTLPPSRCRDNPAPLVCVSPKNIIQYPKM
jgi:hypothetical protein